MDQDTPFRAFIVLHNTDRGPALGGCRLKSYRNENAALNDAMRLAQRGILYAPDYVINAGGLIYAAGRYANRDEDLIVQDVDQIYYRLLRLFVAAQSRNCSVDQVADQQAREILRNDHIKLSA